MPDTPTLLAAVDLGSNSFRLIVGRVETTPAGSQIQQIDAMREPVRLGAGLTREKFLDDAGQERGLAALERFGERLRGFPNKRVRAVATNTLRVAKNANVFIEKAEKALGFPIEVIAGREEARLIYAGAAHTVPPAPDKRLVVDIGGGSTEFIIGHEFEPLLMESLYIGCVSHSREYFANDVVTEGAMRQAILAARREIELIAGTYREAGWQQSIGSSGTARALAELIEENGFNDTGVTHGITRNGLEGLRRALIRGGGAEGSRLIGLKPDRIPVLPGGLAIMIAVFDELGIDYADVTDGALRLGVLYDLMGRSTRHDMRAVTVEGFMQRYSVDRKQARRVGAVSADLWSQLLGPDEGSAAAAVAETSRDASKEVKDVKGAGKQDRGDKAGDRAGDKATDKATDKADRKAAQKSADKGNGKGSRDGRDAKDARASKVEAGGDLNRIPDTSGKVTAAVALTSGPSSASVQTSQRLVANGSADGNGESLLETGKMFLSWASALHEIGLTISHGGYHKHSAYIASNADMPGFSKTDQTRLAGLLLGHVGKLGKFQHTPDIDWDWLFCLRIAVLLSRRRVDDGLPAIRADRIAGGYLLALPREWAEAHPMSEYGLAREAAEWSRVGFSLTVRYI